MPGRVFKPLMLGREMELWPHEEWDRFTSKNLIYSGQEHQRVTTAAGLNLIKILQAAYLATPLAARTSTYQGCARHIADHVNSETGSIMDLAYAALPNACPNWFVLMAGLAAAIVAARFGLVLPFEGAALIYWLRGFKLSIMVNQLCIPNLVILLMCLVYRRIAQTGC